MQQDQLSADRVDGDVHAPVVVVVGRRDATPVDERPGVEADRWAHVGEPALHVREDLERRSVLRQIRDRDGAVRQDEVEPAVVREVDPGVAPAGCVGSDCRREDGADVRERRARGRLERGVALAARVRHEEIGAAVAGVVLGGDAHAGVRVGDAGRAAFLDEVEAERAARLVDVQPVRVEVVGDVEVGPAVAVHVGEHGAEAVIDVLRLDPGLQRRRPGSVNVRSRRGPRSGRAGRGTPGSSTGIHGRRPRGRSRRRSRRRRCPAARRR